MRVVEIFKSRQGEGPNAGREAAFLRLALCNLRCSWCDTKSSWDGGVEMETEEVLAELKRMGVRHLVVTGGEPLLWKRELVPLVKELKSEGWYIEVETNGTIDPGELAQYVDQFNVSPKLSNSGMPEALRIRPEVLRRYAACEKAVFKLVVERREDAEEVEALIRDFGLPRERVYLMSQCADREECSRRDREVTVPMAESLGVRFTPRLHILEGFK
ncbi:7-carboxy-7-deazaguanine synthase QueE [Thermoproteus tenax]|uniref:7-carboxy-7-deazaguanine synthase n=1 Tax=Thermoproteus tenax (strain ATCC 35583 / DSM 2078 / JCM 9277 / NBRC 100435 / Kra 1) TaxID=768679 RepID=G4RN23_THETK|nr:7-carboxy-7-deazaguanine synthase QueE [Thermoproteus tenax]CCC80967.1 organic radical activating enzyme [Thermoproteus tenax Kra 1]